MVPPKSERMYSCGTGSIRVETKGMVGVRVVYTARREGRGIEAAPECHSRHIPIHCFYTLT